MVVEPVGLPGHGDEEDAVTEQRDDEPGPKQTEVPVVQWRDQAKPPCPARRHAETCTAVAGSAGDRCPLHFEAGGELAQDVVELLDLVITVGGSDLDAEADL